VRWSAWLTDCRVPAVVTAKFQQEFDLTTTTVASSTPTAQRVRVVVSLQHESG
jgi:hypothetical protein